VEKCEFGKTVCNSNPNSGKIQIFELGQIRISKITFDFSKQLETLPT